jgi:hypothetical protein
MLFSVPNLNTPPIFCNSQYKEYGVKHNFFIPHKCLIGLTQYNGKRGNVIGCGFFSNN